MVFVWGAVFVGERLAQSCSFEIDRLDDSFLQSFEKISDRKYRYRGGNYDIYLYVVDNIPGFWVSVSGMGALVEWVNAMKQQYSGVKKWVGPTPWR